MTRGIAQRETRSRSGIRSIQRFGGLRPTSRDRLVQASLVCSSEGIALFSQLMNRRDSKIVRQPAGSHTCSGSYSETGIVAVRSRKVTPMRDGVSQRQSPKTTRGCGRMNGRETRE